MTIGSTTSLATNTTTSAGGFYFRSLSLWSDALSVCQAQIATALVRGCVHWCVWHCCRGCWG
jgi:hypothetical protein